MYLLIHQRLADKVHPHKLIWRTDMFGILGRIYHVPKIHRYEILNEMLEMGLLKNFKRDCLEIL